MLLFDVDAELSNILSDTAHCRDSCDSRDLTLLKSRESQESRRATENHSAVVKVLPFALSPHTTDRSKSDSYAFRHGRSVAGSLRTWTGRVVSLDEWRSMSAWDRHGPDGRVFCGIAREWKDADET